MAEQVDDGCRGCHCRLPAVGVAVFLATSVADDLLSCDELLGGGLQRRAHEL
jgi:hypothetical protein